MSFLASLFLLQNVSPLFMGRKTPHLHVPTFLPALTLLNSESSPIQPPIPSSFSPKSLFGWPLIRIPSKPSTKSGSNGSSCIFALPTFAHLPTSKEMSCQLQRKKIFFKANTPPSIFLILLAYRLFLPISSSCLPI